MKNCMGCKYAEWDKTKIGKLHPSGNGKCKYPYQIPDLPNSMYWIGTPNPLGGFIERKREYDKHCLYYQRS